jgi:hypothetical protein
MDERLSQYFLAVGRLCGDAGLGKLTVRLTLADGRVIVGVPEPLRETEGAGELDTIGYADEVTVEGTEVALSDVVEASVTRPDPQPPATGGVWDVAEPPEDERSGATALHRSESTL